VLRARADQLVALRRAHWLAGTDSSGNGLIPAGGRGRTRSGTGRRATTGPRAKRISGERRWSCNTTNPAPGPEMQLKTLLNHVQKYKGFVYDRAELHSGARPRLVVRIRPDARCRLPCSGCEQPANYDAPKGTRYFQFVPMWGLLVFCAYTMRRVKCPRCGVKVEAVPWAKGKCPTTTTYAWFLAHWSKKMSWQEVARRVRHRWHGAGNQPNEDGGNEAHPVWGDVLTQAAYGPYRGRRPVLCARVHNQLSHWRALQDQGSHVMAIFTPCPEAATGELGQGGAADVSRAFVARLGGLDARFVGSSRSRPKRWPPS